MSTAVYGLKDDYVTGILSASTLNDTNNAVEAFFVALAEYFGGGVFRTTDFNLSAGAGLDVDVSAGRAFVGGTGSLKLVAKSGSTNRPGLTASDTSGIYLLPDGTFEAIDSLGTPTAGARKVGNAVTNGTNVTSVNYTGVTYLTSFLSVLANLRGFLAKSIAGGSTVTLNSTESGNGILKLTGVLSASINVVVDTGAARWWWVQNTSTGGFDVTFKGATGTGVTLPRLKHALVYYDGTNMVAVDLGYATIAYVDAGDATQAAALAAHLADATAAHAASAVAFTPAGTIAATTVQAAIEEVAAEAAGGGGDKGQGANAGGVLFLGMADNVDSLTGRVCTEHGTPAYAAGVVTLDRSGSECLNASNAAALKPAAAHFWVASVRAARASAPAGNMGAFSDWKPPGGTGNRAWLIQWNNGSGNWDVLIDPDGTGSSVTTLSAAAPAATGVMSHALAWWDGANLNLSVDGATPVQTALVSPPFVGDGDIIAGGLHGNAATWDGDIEHAYLAFPAVAPTWEQLQPIFNNGALAEWPFGSVTNLPAADSSLRLLWSGTIADISALDTVTPATAVAVLSGLLPAAGVARQVTILLSADVGAGGTGVTAKLYKNGSDTGESLTLSGGGGTEFIAHGAVSAAFAAGDYLRLALIRIGTPGARSAIVEIWGTFD